MIHIAVAGPGDAARAECEAAEAVGQMLAERGALVVTGGLGGVMEAASRGAQAAGGTTVGILPGAERSDANPHVDIALPTGLGQARNIVIVRAADGLVAIGGGYGTLSEIALALRHEKRVVGLGTWDVEGVEAVDTPEAAVESVLRDLNT